MCVYRAAAPAGIRHTPERRTIPMQVPALLTRSRRVPLPVDSRGHHAPAGECFRFARRSGPGHALRLRERRLRLSATPPPQRPNPFAGWQFGGDDGTVISAQHLHLQRDGSISGYTHPNESRWGFEGDVLVFYAQDGTPSTRFSWSQHWQDGRQILRGVALFDRRIVHVLREDDTSARGRAPGSRWSGAPRGARSPSVWCSSRGEASPATATPTKLRWGVEGGTLVFYLQRRATLDSTFSGQSRRTASAFARRVPARSVASRTCCSELDTEVLDKAGRSSGESNGRRDGRFRRTCNSCRAGPSAATATRTKPAGAFEGEHARLLRCARSGVDTVHVARDAPRTVPSGRADQCSTGA